MKNTISMHQTNPPSNSDSLSPHFPKELIEYKNDSVIKKFRDEWSLSEQAACDIFEETKKFLFLANYAQKRCVTFEIDESVLIIDKMWHTFILFTKEYSEFCDVFFGKMLHHTPFCRAHLIEKIRDLSSHGISLSEYKRNRLQQQIDIIHETFGIGTVKKWYVDFGNSYSLQKLNILQRPVYHEDLVHIGSPLDPETARSLTAPQLIEGIIQRQNPSMYCGGHGCGVYCSCNSNKSLYS
ncbi:hypothetical protein LGM65_06635 [Burkholderia anthina]|uniref:glycine-rich domain-containing protein n=1 Tax=Burkholderia anthina TaxID=179879 RepID=UPI001CF1E5F0|nr:hypothetical protein [Burkholderia anthina]MCA8090569.1 hypothetical protein [Burkholderia anthina]